MLSLLGVKGGGTVLHLEEPACCYHSRVSNLSDSSFPLRTVFLDRDGVINRKMPEGEYVTGWEHFYLLPGVAEAIARLNQAGLRVLVVTNQRGVALGLYSVTDVEHIHARLQAELAELGAKIDGFYFCPHDKKDCDCRKPLPGLFLQAQAQFPQIEAGTSVMIGDSLSDMEFGRNLGMRTVFIEGDAEARAHQKPGAMKAAEIADAKAETLPDAVEMLLSKVKHGSV
jgi:D-glycero-D-manno-heptose 1,7-bisphosphate phosphatase